MSDAPDRMLDGGAAAGVIGWWGHLLASNELSTAGALNDLGPPERDTAAVLAVRRILENRRDVLAAERRSYELAAPRMWRLSRLTAACASAMSAATERT
jgi:hypothetical protein